jgi:hypothetical protein
LYVKDLDLLGEYIPAPYFTALEIRSRSHLPADSARAHGTKRIKIPSLCDEILRRYAEHLDKGLHTPTAIVF